MQKDWINFLFTSGNTTTIRHYHTTLGFPSLLSVNVFFCGKTLCPDYKEKWAALLQSTVKPMLKEGSIFGVL